MMIATSAILCIVGIAFREPILYAMGEDQSRERVRLIEVYGRAYCELIAGLS